MAKSVSTIQVLLVVCLAATGYRRAGVALNKGENLLPLAELSDEQVAAFKADKRLTVSVSDVAPTAGSVELSNGDPSLNADGTVTGIVELDGKEKNLEELTVAELKDLAALMQVTDFKAMKKAELISAIQTLKTSVDLTTVKTEANE
ncbi:HI1506-related protein [Shewanella glacialimarina]|uniref:HI1506-related protein n=1 Tax=Shewanella glacialimarina TaxID=2590884 RepID=UPI001CF84430|nr:HI1506-related protein [Shewanella glacialimarina]UCX05428.1 transcription termination factor Rho [Shewanella glacialimarina]